MNFVNQSFWRKSLLWPAVPALALLLGTGVLAEAKTESAPAAQSEAKAEAKAKGEAKAKAKAEAKAKAKAKTEAEAEAEAEKKTKLKSKSNGEKGRTKKKLPRGKAQVIERIMAVVNDEIILLSELRDRMRPLLSQLQRIPDPALRKQRMVELERQALQHMVDEKLIAHEAQKLKINVTARDLDRAIADVMKKNNLTKTQLEQALEREGKTLKAYRHEILKPQLLRLKVLNATVRSRVSVNDDDVRAQYQENLRQLGVQTKVRARHILVALPPNADKRQIAERRRFARSLLKRLKRGKGAGKGKGDDFAALAKRYSDDQVTKGEGGDLGYFGRGTLPAHIEDVVFAMKPGQVQGPLRAGKGFHLIQLIDRQESSARPYAEVRDALRQQVYAEKLEKATKSWLVEVRKRAHLELKN